MLPFFSKSIFQEDELPNVTQLVSDSHHMLFSSSYPVFSVQPYCTFSTSRINFAFPCFFEFEWCWSLYLGCLALLVCPSNTHSSFKAHSKDQFPHEVFLDPFIHSYFLGLWAQNALYIAPSRRLIHIPEMKPQVHIFSHAALLWGLPDAFLPRSCSILEPLCLPAIPRKAWNVTQTSLLADQVEHHNSKHWKLLLDFPLQDVFEFVWNSYGDTQIFFMDNCLVYTSSRLSLFVTRK